MVHQSGDVYSFVLHSVGNSILSTSPYFKFFPHSFIHITRINIKWISSLSICSLETKPLTGISLCHTLYNTSKILLFTLKGVCEGYSHILRLGHLVNLLALKFFCRFSHIIFSNNTSHEAGNSLLMCLPRCIFVNVGYDCQTQHTKAPSEPDQYHSVIVD